MTWIFLWWASAFVWFVFMAWYERNEPIPARWMDMLAAMAVSCLGPVVLVFAAIVHIANASFWTKPVFPRTKQDDGKR
jgi:hypothetical protein